MLNLTNIFIILGYFSVGFGIALFRQLLSTKYAEIEPFDLKNDDSENGKSLVLFIIVLWPFYLVLLVVSVILALILAVLETIGDGIMWLFKKSAKKMKEDLDNDAELWFFGDRFY